MKLKDRQRLKTFEENEEQKINWKVISSVITFVLLVVAGFSYKDITAKRILNIRANDISESGLEHQDILIQHCKVSQRNQIVGDFSVEINFADKAEVVNERQIENQLDFASCNFDTSASAFGRLPGTSVLDLFRLTNTVVQGYRTRGIDYPLVFTLTLDAAEPVPGEPPLDDKSLNEVKKIANELASNGQIIIIGPSTTLQQKLKKHLEANKNIKVCPYSNVKNCTEKAIKEARK